MSCSNHIFKLRPKYVTVERFTPLSYSHTHTQYFTLSAEDPEIAVVTGTTGVEPTPSGSKVEWGVRGL